MFLLAVKYVGQSVSTSRSTSAPYPIAFYLFPTPIISLFIYFVLFLSFFLPSCWFKVVTLFGPHKLFPNSTFSEFIKKLIKFNYVIYKLL